MPRLLMPNRQIKIACHTINKRGNAGISVSNNIKFSLNVITSVFVTSVFTLHEWWRHHHLPERLKTCNEYFKARVVPHVIHTRVL